MHKRILAFGIAFIVALAFISGGVYAYKLLRNNGDAEQTVQQDTAKNTEDLLKAGESPTTTRTAEDVKKVNQTLDKAPEGTCPPGNYAVQAGNGVVMCTHGSE